MTIFRNILVFTHFTGVVNKWYYILVYAKQNIYTFIHLYKTLIIKQYLISDWFHTTIKHQSNQPQSTIKVHILNNALILIWIKTITNHPYITDLILALQVRTALSTTSVLSSSCLWPWPLTFYFPWNLHS